MSEPLLRRRELTDVAGTRRDPVEPEALAVARPIVEDVRRRGETALREHAERLGDVARGGPLFLEPADLHRALEALAPDDRSRLERVAERIRAFAMAQRGTFAPLSVAVPGGRAGHDLVPLDAAGCYAPGGRHPLPSSVLMTAVVARAAGVRSVWIASPRPASITLAAAAVAGADGLLAAGGAQAIAALAFGAGVLPPSDAVVGPGNRYVTAAKLVVAGHVRIDMLAGPSELVILADAGSDPITIAADLLAQAEHDTDAMPLLVSLDEGLVERVEAEMARQMQDLPTADVARAALRHGGAIVVSSLDEALAACDAIAPEHLEILVERPAAVAARVRHAGALFIGHGAGEVLGDYGAGPNHVLPTGGTARFTAGLSVATFLRQRTWLRIDDPEAARELAEDSAWLARLEGLEAHARSAERRRPVA